MPRITGYPDVVTVPAHGKHTSTVLFIHGLTESAEDWLSLVKELQKDIPGSKFVLPTAKKMHVILHDGALETAWYNVKDLQELNEDEDKETLHASIEYIQALIHDEIAAGIDSSQVVVAGFSKGGVMSLLNLKKDVPLGGILSICGYLMLADESPIVSEANAKTPVLMCNGVKDEIVAFRYPVHSKELLTRAKAKLQFLSYQNDGHTASPAMVRDIKDFLRKCLL